MAYDFSVLLSESEQRLFADPSSWRWIAEASHDEIKPVRRPSHLKWSQHTGGHSLPTRELCLCLSGGRYATLNNAVYKLTPGSVILYDQDDWHDRLAAPNEGFGRYLWIHMPNRHFVSSNLFEYQENGQIFNEELKFTSQHMAPIITENWERCVKEASSRVYWEFLKVSLTFMLFESASAYNQTGELDSKEQVVDRVCEYVDNNLKEDLSLNRLAELAGYSPFFFHRLFRRYREIPPHTYVVNARLERAKTLLREGFTIEIICEDIGINPPSYFSSFFQKHTGFLPSRWREIHGVDTERRRLELPRKRRGPLPRNSPSS